jgi:hypothetical protein
MEPVMASEERGKKLQQQQQTLCASLEKEREQQKNI